MVYTKLRSTYLHEVDSARGFADFNDPDEMRNAADFKRAAAKIGYTFNWFYADDRDIAYYQLRQQPGAGDAAWTRTCRRRRGSSGGLQPRPELAPRYTPFATHPQT